MKKKSFVLFLLMCCALLLCGCTSQAVKTEEEILADMQERKLPEECEGAVISGIEIIKRQTNQEDKQDIVYVTMQAESENAKLVRSYKLEYNLYDEGWVLDTVEQYSEGENSTTALGDPPVSVIDDFFARQNEQINAHNSTYANESKDYIISNPVYSSWEVTGRETNFETGRSIVYVSASRETPFLITHEKLAFPVTFSSDGMWHILEIDILNVNDAIQSIELDWSKLTSLNFTKEFNPTSGKGFLRFESIDSKEKTIKIWANSDYSKSAEYRTETDILDITYDTKYDLSNFQACRNQIYQDIDEGNGAFRLRSGRALRNTYAPIAPTSLYFLAKCDSGYDKFGEHLFQLRLNSYQVYASIAPVGNFFWPARDYM